MTTALMTRAPRVVKQLPDPPWGPYNCVFATTTGLAQFASGGRVKSDPDTMRARAGRLVANPTQKLLDTLGPSNISDTSAALRHPDTTAEFKAVGLQPVRFRFLGKVKRQVIKAYLRQDVRVTVAIAYHVLNDKRPRNSGSRTFNIPSKDHHAVAWQGLYGADGKPWVSGKAFTDQIDPLCDGRHAGVAKGPQRIPLWLAFAEAEGYAGKGLIYAGVVKPSFAIVVPPPVDPCAIKVAEAVAPIQGQLATADAEVDRLQGVIRQLGAGLADTGTTLQELAAIANDPANTGGDA